MPAPDFRRRIHFIPIIICTGFSDEKDEQGAKAMGIKGFLMKPVTTGDFATLARKVLDEAKGALIREEHSRNNQEQTNVNLRRALDNHVNPG